MKNIAFLLEKYRNEICKDPGCPDYGKMIEIFDGTYNGISFHIEVIDQTTYNIQVDNGYGRFGLTYEQMENFVRKYI